MTPVAPYTSRCRKCGSEIAAEAEKCLACGAPNLEERCPHCGSVTTASPDKELRWRCDVCGGPRLPRVDPAYRVRGGRAGPHLRRANQARKDRAKYRALAAVFAAMGFGTTALAGLWALIFGLGIGLAATWALFAGSALFVVLWSLGRASSKTKELGPAVDQAWMSAAADVAARMKGAFTASKLAQVMSIDEAQAEELLALLDANDVVRSDVTEAGEVAYQTKLRVGPVGAAITPEDEAEALAEAEAMAAEERGAKAAK
jgi:hypothetical protein